MRKEHAEPDTAGATPASDAGTTGATSLTQLLAGVRDGDRAALDRAVALVYDELHRLARRQLRRERAGHTLQPTALVHEAWLRIADASSLAPSDRGHFMAVTVRAMRQVLVDHARQRQALKRGGDLVRTTLAGKDVAAAPDGADLLALDAALDRLGGADPRARQVVEYRFFAGLGEEETATLLGLSARTVRREWVKARAWLHKELQSDPA